MSFEILQEVRRPPMRVFEYVADAANMPHWYEAVVSVEPVTGTRFRMVRALPGGPAVNEVELATCLPGEEVTFVSVSGPTPFRYDYRFTPTATGTRLTLHGQISAEGLPGPGRHFGGLAERLFKQGMGSNLRTLARLLESPGAA